MEPTWTSGEYPGGGVLIGRLLGNRGWVQLGGYWVLLVFFAKLEGTKKLVRWLHSGYMRGSSDSEFL